MSAAEDSRERLIAKVRKMLSKVKSAAEHADASAADKTEAARAFDVANQLMVKHGLTDEDVSDDVSEIADTKRDACRDEIAAAVGLLLGCKAFPALGGGIEYRGYCERVRAACSLYRTIIREGEAGQEIAAEVYVSIANVNGKTIDYALANSVWLAIYWPGFVSGICPRLWRMKEGEKHAPTSPRIEEAAAVMAAAVSQIAPKIVDRLQWFKNKGFEAGKRRGEKLDIEAPIAGAQKIERVFALLG